MKTVKLKDVHCLSCNEKLVGSAGVTDDDLPSDGDLSICFVCGGISFFEIIAGEYKLRPGSEEELEEVVASTDYHEIRRLIDRAKAGQL